MNPPKPIKTIFPAGAATIDPETQKMLNNPLQKPGALEPADEAFLKTILGKTERGEIQLYIPSSLLNHKVYDALALNQKSIADMQAFSTLTTIREMVNLWKVYQTPTFQLQNLIHKVRLVKERFEQEMGDVFII